MKRLVWCGEGDLEPPRDCCARFYAALTGAGAKPEVHIYRAGGHGFGMTKQGTTTDHWIDEFYYWLETQGLTKGSGGR